MFRYLIPSVSEHFTSTHFYLSNVTRCLSFNRLYRLTQQGKSERAEGLWHSDEFHMTDTRSTGKAKQRKGRRNERNRRNYGWRGVRDYVYRWTVLELVVTQIRRYRRLFFVHKFYGSSSSANFHSTRRLIFLLGKGESRKTDCSVRNKKSEKEEKRKG